MDYIHDIDVAVDIDHDWVGQLGLFLSFDNHGSTICVELSTKNGGFGANYKNTIFDDQAPKSITAGSAPFTGRFSPEGKLSDFFNARMDGTWSLWVADNGDDSVGVLNTWSLMLDFGDPSAPLRPVGLTATGQTEGIVLNWEPSPGATTYNLYWSHAVGTEPATGTLVADVTPPFVHGPLAPGEVYFYVVTAQNEYGESAPSLEVMAAPSQLVTEADDANVTIPDNSGHLNGCTGTNGLSRTLTITATDQIQDVNVMVDITHPFDGDVDLYLQFDNHGTPVCVELATDVGSTGDNFTGTIFDDQATTAIASGSAPFTGAFRPKGSLAPLNGLAMNGNWTLRVSDDANGDVGKLVRWALDISYGPSMPPARINDLTAKASDQSVVLNWTPSPGATSYTLLWSTTPGVGLATGTAIDVTAPPPYKHENLVNLTTYYYAIAPRSAVGMGPVSAEVSATPFPVLTKTIQAGLDIVDNVGNATECGLEDAAASAIDISDAGVIGSVVVTVNITHDYAADVDLWLEYQSGATVYCIELSTDNGGGGDNFTNTVFDDNAEDSIEDGTPPYTGTFKPEGELSVLHGLPVAGVWTLYASDDASIGDGTLDSWELTIGLE